MAKYCIYEVGEIVVFKENTNPNRMFKSTIWKYIKKSVNKGYEVWKRIN